jgi:hypothetical protein
MEVVVSLTDKRIEGYPGDPPQERELLHLKTYEYRMPFNYPNATVDRVWHGRESVGVELFPIKQTDIHVQSGLPADSIVIEEDEPIVRVAVIGSACTPPGYVTLEAELVEGQRRGDELIRSLPVRFRADNLWGMHLRWDLVQASPDVTYKQLPVAGMSCAVFEIPKSRKVWIKAGSTIPGWHEDNYPDDIHYAIRIVRTTVVSSASGDR